MASFEKLEPLGEKVEKHKDQLEKGKLEKSQAARDIADTLFGDVQTLKKELRDPKNAKMLEDNIGEYDKIDGQVKRLTDTINDPSLRDPITGAISADGMKQIQDAYNSLKKTQTTLQGIVNGAPGKATQERDDQMKRNDDSKKKETLDRFTEDIKKREGDKILEQAKDNQKKAQEIGERGNQETGSTSEKVAFLEEKKLEGGFQVEYP